jgi:hypothetical protein
MNGKISIIMATTNSSSEDLLLLLPAQKEMGTAILRDIRNESSSAKRSGYPAKSGILD